MKSFYFSSCITSMLLLFSLSFNANAQDIIDDLFAQDSQLVNSIVTGISNDTENATIYDLDLSLAINDLTQFLLFTQYTNINDPNVNFDSRSVDIGFRYRAQQSVSIALYYIKSGQQGQLMATTLRSALSYYAVNWDFTVSPEKSAIKLSNIRRTVTQTALGLNFNYYFTTPLSLGFTFVKYQYDRNPQLLNRLVTRRIITIQTVSLANNYYDNYYTASLMYGFELVSHRYSYSQSLSAVDNLISKTHSLDFVYSPVNRLSIYFSVGSNQQQDLATSQFYRIALGYFW